MSNRKKRKKNWPSQRYQHIIFPIIGIIIIFWWIMRWNTIIAHINKNFLGNETYTYIQNFYYTTSSIDNNHEDHTIDHTMIDIISDDSIHKFVWRKHHLSNIDYEPNDLVDMTQSPFLYINQWWYLRKEAFDQLDLLAREFYQTFNTKLIIVSAYRTHWHQKQLLSLYKQKIGTSAYMVSAKPWHSEHQLWLAIDIFSASNETDFFKNENYKLYRERFKNNAHRFGYHQSYQRWPQKDWFIVEPRHRRYLWRELATYLFDNNITFTEYVQTYHNLY